MDNCGSKEIGGRLIQASFDFSDIDRHVGMSSQHFTHSQGHNGIDSKHESRAKEIRDQILIVSTVFGESVLTDTLEDETEHKTQSYTHFRDLDNCSASKSPFTKKS